MSARRVKIPKQFRRLSESLIAQLRTGYAEMNATRMGEPKQLATSVADRGHANGPPSGMEVPPPRRPTSSPTTFQYAPPSISPLAASHYGGYTLIR
jgi:hypothetical protein